jgi:hypothetical protein
MLQSFNREEFKEAIDKLVEKGISRSSVEGGIRIGWVKGIGAVLHEIDECLCVGKAITESESNITKIIFGDPEGKRHSQRQSEGEQDENECRWVRRFRILCEHVDAWSDSGSRGEVY